uniref:Uncharacterized protein n=1 Tax=Physcomitrium patens TaxID=3218 RepID=A0A2K1L052_PHYPA|nr:hypothetical protein PHYPA_002192 [Physcomitrium patens]
MARSMFALRGELGWMNQRQTPYGFGGNSMRTEMRVVTCCNKCEEKAREEISEVYGECTVRLQFLPLADCQLLMSARFQ